MFVAKSGATRHSIASRLKQSKLPHHQLPSLKRVTARHLDLRARGRALGFESLAQVIIEGFSRTGVRAEIAIHGGKVDRIKFDSGFAISQSVAPNDGQF